MLQSAAGLFIFMLAGGKHTLIPSRIPRNLPHCTALTPPPPGSHRIHASLVQREVAKIGSSQPIFDGGIAYRSRRFVLLKSRHFPVFQIAPCRGRYFLVRQESTQRTDPGRRFKCGLSTVGRNRSILPRPQSALPWVPLPPLRVSYTLSRLFRNDNTARTPLPPPVGTYRPQRSFFTFALTPPHFPNLAPPPGYFP